MCGRGPCAAQGPEQRREFNVSGVTGIRGLYSPAAQKQNIMKRMSGGDGCPCFLYYWDNRDGERFQGWWFAEAYGSDSVYGFAPSSNEQNPPIRGYRIPWNAPHATVGANQTTVHPLDKVKTQ